MIIRPPSLIILSEPTFIIDPFAEQRQWDNILNQVQESTRMVDEMINTIREIRVSLEHTLHGRNVT